MSFVRETTITGTAQFIKLWNRGIDKPMKLDYVFVVEEPYIDLRGAAYLKYVIIVRKIIIQHFMKGLQV